MQAHWLTTPRLLPPCSGWSRCLIRSGMIRASKNSSLRPCRKTPRKSSLVLFLTSILQYHTGRSYSHCITSVVQSYMNESLVVRFLTNEAISIEVIDGHGFTKTRSAYPAHEPSDMKTLASQIKRELNLGERKHCAAVYERELKRLWPLNQKNREAKMSQFAAEYGLRLRFYRTGLCAIFDEWPRSAPLSSKRERARLRSPASQR